jgi:hypothetical protein
VISGVAIGVFILWPMVVAIATAAQRLLTTEIVSTGMAIRYTLGVLGIFLAMLALLDIANTASELGATEQIENLGKSADVSTGTVDTLADSLDNLGESSKGLETFLASFDEVNKVGGGNSLMSSLVTKDDLANILGAATGISDLQNELNSLTMPDITGGIFSAEWWEEKKEMIFGFLDTIGTHEFVDNWKSGIMDIDSWLAENMPRWHSFFTNLGADIYDALHPDAEKDTRETFTYISSSGRAVEGLKYNDDGTLTQAYLNQMQNTASSGTSTQQTVTSTTATQPVDITLMLDGRTIASVVSDYQNQRARSSGNQSLVGG